MEIGQTGVLACLFSENLYSVFWYNSTDIVNDRPILNYKEHIRSGYGYESGEYDVTKEGSLIINEVQLNHETMFTVLKFNTRSEAPVMKTIRVVVTGRYSLCSISSQSLGDIPFGCIMVEDNGLAYVWWYWVIKKLRLINIGQMEWSEELE